MGCFVTVAVLAPHRGIEPRSDRTPIECPNTVTVSADHFTLRNLGENARGAAFVAGTHRKRFYGSGRMIEIHRCEMEGTTAVNTWPRFLGPDHFTLRRLPAPSFCCVGSPVSFVMRLHISARTRLALIGKAVWISLRCAEGVRR